MKNENRLYVDVHVLQTVPPSCVNRDDTGSPKTAVYGGATRARISSQCWKRAMRTMFVEQFPVEKLAVRTKRIVDMVASEIEKIGGTSAQEKAQQIISAAGLKIKSLDKGTDALFFISYAQAAALAKLIVEDVDMFTEPVTKEAKLKAQNALKEHPGIDIALFGRMVADDPSLNTDACAQVAHSISTHKVSNEYDYFTAVDDLSPEDNAGAAHIGTVEFNSATFYRYATLAVHALNRNLHEDTAEAVCEFVRSFICSMPDGKQNTFANRTLPDAILVTVRTEQPLNLVGAFEKPVPASDEGYVAASASRLGIHAKNLYKNFAGEPALSLTVGSLLSGLGEMLSLPELLKTLKADILNRMKDGGDAQ